MEFRRIEKDIAIKYGNDDNLSNFLMIKNIHNKKFNFNIIYKYDENEIIIHYEDFKEMMLKNYINLQDGKILFLENFFLKEVVLIFMKEKNQRLI